MVSRLSARARRANKAGERTLACDDPLAGEPECSTQPLSDRRAPTSGNRSGTGSRRSAGTAKCSPPICRRKIRRSSRCPMSARQNGIWRIPAGFSRPSFSDRSIRAIAPSTRPSPICSIPITRRSDRATRGRNAASCRARRSTRSAPIATTSPLRCCGLPTRPAMPVWREATPLIELGLHHEQQHQELMLMDIKHVFSVNPLLPAYQAPRPYACPAVRHGAGLDRVRRRAARDRT